MPLQAMTDAEIATATEAMDAEFLLQLQRCDVSPHIIAVLAAARFTTVMKFQMIGDDVADVGRAAKVLGLEQREGDDPATALQTMSSIASLKTAWASCRRYQQAEDQNKADTKVLGLIAPMKSSEYMNIRLAFEKAHSVLEEQAAGTEHLGRYRSSFRRRDLSGPEAGGTSKLERSGDSLTGKSGFRRFHDEPQHARRREVAPTGTSEIEPSHG